MILFDADGTLMDSEKDVFLCFKYILKSNLNIDIGHESFQKMAGLSLEKVFEGVLKTNQHDLAIELTKKYREYYIDEKHFLDNTVLFDGVRETLKELKSNGFILVIVSSKPKRALEYMVNYFDLNMFDLLLGTGESNFKHKPDPEVINYSLKKFNIDKKDAIIVGDTQADIIAGHNAGIDSIALTYGYDTIENLEKNSPTYIINRFNEILEIIEFKK